MAGPLVVLDTNVVVAGLRSRRGASFRVLSQLGTEAFAIAVSVPLALEYEDVVLDQREQMGLSRADVATVVDYLCAVAKRQEIFFLWRPVLRDPKDDMILELAVAAGCEAIVTHNRRHFEEAGTFGIRVLSPAELLEVIGESV